LGQATMAGERGVPAGVDYASDAYWDKRYGRVSE
jgi:hypothetical protein